MDEKTVFGTLNKLDVSAHIEKKKTGGKEFSYLSWPWAWKEVKSRYPAAEYNIMRFKDNLPYVYDENTGYMVFTSVTIDGITHGMQLPVMDSHNAAMKSEPYTVQTKNNSFNVPAATMFDIHKSIMRCLVKNLAMFGLGLYIYSGEDVPELEQEAPPICEECNEPVPELRGKDGNIKKSAFEIANFTMKECDKTLCWSCYKKRLEAGGDNYEAVSE